MKLLQKYKYDIFIALFVLTAAILFVAFKDQFGILSDRENFEELVKSFGVWAPLVIILSVVLEVVIAPLPGFIPAISAGFIFGPLEGSIYTYIGNVLGSLLVFWIARRFGKLILEKIINKAKLEKYERLIERRENVLLLFYIFPIFPVDILSGAFGISKISLRKFAAAIAIGFIFHVFILNYFGDFLARLYFMV